MADISRRRLLATAAAAACAAPAVGRDQAAAGDRLAALLADGDDGVVSAGVILRHGDGRIGVAASAGQRRLAGVEASWAPFSLDDPFRVASVSKMVAATGFMRLVEQGRVGLDQDAGSLLGFRLRHPSFPDLPITIRHLLSHTSALRNGPSYPVPAGHGLSEAFSQAGRHYDGGAWFGPDDKPPGLWFAYADVNFCLIAQIIERVTSERFDRYMSRTVLAKLDLDAGYNWSGVSQRKRDRAVPGLRWREGRWTVQVDGTVPPAPECVFPQPRDQPPLKDADLTLGDNGFLFSPQGGLRVSLWDMDRLAGFFRSGGRMARHPIIAPAMIEAMQRPVWTFDPAHANGDQTEGAGNAGIFGRYGLGVEAPAGRHAGDGDAFFGVSSPDWRGHLGDAYGLMTGLFWNRVDGRTLVYALNGVRDSGRKPGQRSALTIPEEQVIDIALAAG